VKISQTQKQKKLALLESISHERSLPVTVQRRVVLDALLDRYDHPTVDQLHEDVKERMPGVSRTTIYRALETLVDLGLARHQSPTSARFDGNTDHHHHPVCRSCNHVTDIDHPSLKICAADLMVSPGSWTIHPYQGRLRSKERCEIEAKGEWPRSTNRFLISLARAISAR
jgi:Fur family peroxide stress response transcriptional regulator